MMRALRDLLALCRGLPRGERSQALAKSLAEGPALSPRPRGPAIAMQCIDDATYMAILSGAARCLAEREDASIDVIFVRSISGATGLGPAAAARRSSLIGWLIARQWLRLLAPLRPRVGYRSRSWAATDIIDLWLAYRVWQRVRQQAGNFSVSIAGIEVGDLIVDSYLRFRPSPRFDRRHALVWAALWQAHRDVRRARCYFRTRRPVLYLTAYTTYIEHGIAVRAALQAGVPIRAFGNFQAIGMRVTPEHPFHTADTSAYAGTFDSLGAGAIARALEQAEVGLRRRLGGGIDDATRYMKASAYASGSEHVPDVRGAMIVFLHDFYDSPHVYADLVFQDFWDWIVCTIDTLRANGTPIFLKPHPNQISLSEGALDDLRRLYPELRFLSPRISNVQLAEAGMLGGVTVYGTVAHELAYLGVPTISCARHPHHAFDFCRTARTVEEYRRMLCSPGDMPVPLPAMRRQALAFYYMHNLHGDPADLELRRRFVDFWSAGVSDSASVATWASAYCELLATPGFASFSLAPG
jgi:hypothetical protein